jgi:hypothetical protein
MSTLSIQNLLGYRANENFSNIQISKADLDLTAHPVNNGESLFAGIIQCAMSAFAGNLVDESGNLIVDESGNLIAYDFEDYYDKLNISYWGTNTLTRSDGKQYTAYTFLIDFFVTPAPIINSSLDINLI